MNRSKTFRPSRERVLKFFVSSLRYVLLTGLCFIILYPFLLKFSSVLMSQQDIADQTVKLVPRNPTLFNLQTVIVSASAPDARYFPALAATAGLALLTGLLQTVFCALIGYGFAKFRFKFNNLAFALVVFTMIIPPETLSVAYYMSFKDFDLLWLPALFFGRPLAAFSTLNTLFPFIVLSMTGLGFKNGLYIFMMRQFFRGVPSELNEAADVDGAGPLRTFFQVILPLSVPMMTTIFLFSFSWQWTDSYYTGLFIRSDKIPLLARVIEKAGTLPVNGAPLQPGSGLSSVMLNTAAFLVIIPLLIVFILAQKKFVQGIESSGIVG